MRQTDTRRKSGPDVAWRAWLIYLTIAVVATGVYFLLAGAASAIVYNLIGVSMLAAIFTGIRWHRPADASPWYVILLGLCLYVAGDVVFFNIYPNVLGAPAPFPSIADALYLSSYVVVAFGISLTVRRRGQRDLGGLIDAAVIASGLGMFTWVLLVEPYTQDRSLSLLVQVVSAAYPLMSVLWVAVAARIVFMPGRRTTALYLLIAAVFFHPISDFVYAWLVLKGTYHNGMAVDAGWTLSYAFFGAAALHPSMRDLSTAATDRETAFSGWRLLLLGAAAMMLPTVLIIDTVRGNDIQVPVFSGGAAILFILILARLYGVLRANQRVSEEVRSLNRNLESRVKERTEELEKTLLGLSESEARFRLLVEGVQDYSIFMLDPRGRIVTWNKGAENNQGYTASEIIGEHFSVFYTPEDRERGHPEEELRVAVATGRYEEEGVRVRKDGTQFLANIIITAVHNGSGELNGFLKVARDVTEQKQYEGRLLQAREEAESAARFKSEFLANMSHEIRTPMNGVIGMTSLLLDTELTDEQRDYARTIRSSGENLLTIINDILDFSKIEAGKLNIETLDFDLRHTIEEALALFAERAHEKDLELTHLVNYDVPGALRGDPGRVTQILTNLIGNAIKFTEEGEVVLRVKMAEETEERAKIRFEVVDTGIGLTPEQQGRLFQSFTQADASTTRRFGGTGLGLAISKQLVELMGGEIGVHSEAGAGSTFWFELPFEKQPRQAPPRPRTDLQGLRVLVVDDNATNREIIHQLVLSWGMKNGTAEDGQSALRVMRLAAEGEEPYDVAILDMHMPGMNGMELASKIKADPAISATRLVLLTSLGQRGEATQARKAGISAYLTKPARASQLFDTLATVIGTPEETEGETMPIVTRHTILEERSRSRAHILVAEDNAINQKVAVRMLESLGYRVDVAANGREALQALARLPYAAILMDVHMPEMDGYTATRKIRDKEEYGGSRHVPIIALTASAMEYDRELALSAGMDDFVTKPVKREVLEEALERWISPEGDEMPAGSETSENPLDCAAIENLRELGGQEMLAELTEVFTSDSQTSLDDLKRALEEGDAGSTERTAHTLKGSSANMGARRMSSLSADLESAGASGDLSSAPGLLEDLEIEFERVREALETEVKDGAQ